MLTLIAALSLTIQAAPDDDPITAMRKKGLVELGAYSMLHDLTTTVGHRLTGSPGCEQAITWVQDKLRAMGATNIGQVPCMIPKWTRGNHESAVMSDGTALSVCALGLSVGTPPEGIEAELIEVKSLKEAEALGNRAKGKIVFYNRGFDQSKVGADYGGAVDQRSAGPGVASKVGAVAVLVRSMTINRDDAPHTGTTRYGDATPIPAAALGLVSADKLSGALKSGPVKVKLTLSCANHPEVPSGSPYGEIRGWQKPDEVIVMGGHLDSWDLGTGAHDDGGGVVAAMEALRLMKELGLRPKRTIRVIGWQNEETMGRGADSYLAYAQNAKEKHFAAIESDSGVFMPTAFGATKSKLKRLAKWQPLLEDFGIHKFREGGGAADNGPLEKVGAILFSLDASGQRYFDLHHSRNDTIASVHPREIEMCALAMGSLAWLLSERGDELK